VDYWVSRYLTHAENIRRGIELIKLGEDYYPMLDFLHSPASDWRGLMENGFGYGARDEWQPVFQPLGHACGIGAETLQNNQWKGMNWLRRDSLGEDRVMLDRDDSHTGDTARVIAYACEDKVLDPPAVFPRHPVDKAITAKPGQRCPRTGVWVPSQWIDDGAGDFSLAFCLEGRPMQPAYRIVGREVRDVWEEYDLKLGVEHEPVDPHLLSGTLVTQAEDTTWYFMHKPEALKQLPARPRLRCEANEPCPREGWWFTPAKPGSRRHFKQGEVMPEFRSDWGRTIWQWDEAQ
jgi:hypothetical protein